MHFSRDKCTLYGVESNRSWTALSRVHRNNCLERRLTLCHQEQFTWIPKSGRGPAAVEGGAWFWGVLHDPRHGQVIFVFFFITIFLDIILNMKRNIGICGGKGLPWHRLRWAQRQLVPCNQRYVWGGSNTDAICWWFIICSFFCCNNYEIDFVNSILCDFIIMFAVIFISMATPSALSTLC